MKMSSPDLTLGEHLEELRRLLIRLLFVIVTGFALCFLFYKPLFQAILSPLHDKAQVKVITAREAVNTGTTPAPFFDGSRNHLLQPGEVISLPPPQNETALILLSPLEGMTTTLKLCLWVSLIATSPVWLYFVALFIAPAIKSKARRLLPLFLVLLICFGGFGLAFAHFVTIPIANRTLASFNEGIGLDLWSLSHYFDYTVLLHLGHILVFEGAALMLFLVYLGTLDYHMLASKRKHAYLVGFIIAAVITPPDIVTQITLAIPMLCLYEMVVLYSRFCNAKSGVLEAL